MATNILNNGRYRMDVNYRDFSGDEGVSIRLFGPVRDKDEELVRFDCFEKTPHYHIGVYDKNEITSLRDEKDPVEYALTRLITEFKPLVSAAGGDEPSGSEQSDHIALRDELTSKVHSVIQDAKKPG